MPPPTRRRKALTSALALTALAAVVAGAVLVTRSASPSGRVPFTFTPAALGAEPPGAVVLAGEDDELAVALAVRPASDRLLLVATVLGQDGLGTRDLDVSFRLFAAGSPPVDLRATAGSPGYYEAETSAPSRPTRVEVTVAGSGATATPVDFRLPASWPPAPAERLVARADRVYARLRTLVTHELIAADRTHRLVSVYRAKAPDSLDVTSADGSEAILIGGQRWDRAGNQPWRHSIQITPVQAVRPFWVGPVEDAALLGSASVRGRRAWVVSFAAPRMPAFFTVWIDERTGRTLQLRMTAAAHFMRHVYGPFDTGLRISPPRPS